uniref:Uncharacterized protein n=1 Tax=Anopheles culicifacies TaxID=139723 RepID=A0A182MQD7_9DIPT
MRTSSNVPVVGPPDWPITTLLSLFQEGHSIWKAHPPATANDRYEATGRSVVWFKTYPLTVLDSRDRISGRVGKQGLPGDADTSERPGYGWVIDPDDLPQRARWTIIATACLLLIMCLLLVGITLRMAPIIDDMGKFWAGKGMLR